MNPAMRDRALDAARINRAAALQEAGCLRFDYFESVEEPGRLVFVEEWADQAALDAHFAATNFSEFMAAFLPCLDGEPEIRVFDAKVTGA